MPILKDETKKLIQQQTNTIPVNTVIGEYKNSGTFTVTIPEDGVYEIYCIAPGGAENANLGSLLTPIEE